MSPKRNNGKGSKAPSSVSPIKFNAGGSKQTSQSNKKQHDNDAVADASSKKNEVASSDSNVSRSASNSSGNGTTITTSSAVKEQEVNGAPTAKIQWITTGLQKKQSPFTLKHWIATVLTLDGRDKFTKIMQYSCRLLGWYFAGLATAAAAARTNTIGTSTTAITSSGGGGSQIMLYQALSTRFTSLYKSLVTSRKAFRMGRSVIEWDKIRSMGWGEYLGYWIRHPLEEGVAAGEKKEKEGGSGGDDCHLLGRLETHPIPEEQDEDAAALEAEDDDKSWNGEETTSTTVEEKKDDTASATTALSEKKVISRPGRPILPSRMSSNIGWGPSTTAIATEEDASETHHPPARTVSEMGRQMYRPYPTQSSTSFGSYQQLKGTKSTLAKQTPTTTPAWKLIGGTLKLFGLMGFWAFDNLSFLTSSGFLDPITTTTTTKSDTATIRTKRKQRASEYGARCYFMGCLAGLYVNLRSFWIHGNGPLVEARRRYESAITTNTTTTSSGDGKEGDESDNAQHALKKTEQKHFELFLALLKSLCDVTVFSNNPGIDLHLKLRGKKNHEGFHCLCGLISAGTVLYNNFPNAE